MPQYVDDMSDELIAYIDSQLKTGISENAIRVALASAKWPKEHVDQAFAALAAPSAPVAAVAPAPVVAAFPVLQSTGIQPIVEPKVTANAARAIGHIDIPGSLRAFEILSYASVLAGIIATYARMWSVSGTLSLESLQLPLLTQIPFALGTVVLTWLAVRKRMNWARWVLIAFFALGGFGIVAGA